MLCIYKNERTKGKIFCPRPSMTSAFVSPCQNVIAAHYGALPEPGRKPVHGVEGGKHCHHEYSSDADLGFIRRHVLSFSNQTFFVKELKEDFTVLSMLMLMPSWKLDIMMYVCMNVCRTFSKAFDCSQKRGVVGLGLLECCRQIKIYRLTWHKQQYVMWFLTRHEVEAALNYTRSQALWRWYYLLSMEVSPWAHG